MKMDLILIGDGEHASVVLEAALSGKTPSWNVLGYLSPEGNGTNFNKNCPRLGVDEDIPRLLEKYPNAKFICALGKNEQRRKIVAGLKLPSEKYATIIHREAFLAGDSFIAEGTVVLRRAALQPGAKIGKHCIVNTGSIIEHDVIVGDFSHVAPGVITGGGVKIGCGCFIGIGAKIRDHICLGENVIVGIGSVVVTDIGDGETVVGIPARRLSSMTACTDIRDLCISPDTMLFDAISLVGKMGSAVLVTDADMHLLGLLNDGDIRRALLEKKDLNSPVAEIMNKQFKFVRQNVPRVVVLDTLNALGHAQMPVIDDKGRVVALHTMSAMIGSMALPNRAIIMAGGRGIRLKPITDTIPKPMVKVAGRPILEHLILHLAGSNVREIFISINYLGEIIENYFKDGSTYGVKIHYLRETSPLGTAGALRLLPEAKDNHPIICMNGDLVTQFDVESMLNYHSQGGYDMTIGVRDHRVEIPYGVVEWDDRKEEVIGIREKPEEHFIINGGIYVINPNLVKLIEPDKEVLMTDFINKCLENRIRVGVHLVEGDWIDVGQHKELAAARGM